jgi:hypothetical protein
MQIRKEYQAQSAQVIKNWDPLEFTPVLAIESVPLIRNEKENKI